MASTFDCEVTVATNGAMAIAVAEQWQPDIVVLDLMMPGMDGYEVAQRLPAGTKIVAVSARPLDATLAARFDRYLPKPVLKESLGQVIRQLGT